jgi:S-adenosylmethionine:tRNA ribosyltransferase-isomerase
VHPKYLEIKNFTYDLPEERIAKYPLEERDASKLLVYRDGKILEDVYRNISEYISENSLLIFNNTRVIPARLIFHNSTGARIEIFCLEPAGKNEDISSAMSKTENAKWICMIGRASKWKESVLQIKGDGFTLTAEIYIRLSGTFKVEFKWTPVHLTFAEILVLAGAMPIPPYLKRDSEAVDINRYQTVYAKNHGSVAAPTAGLHFTENVFENLKAKNISTDEVTLHVGAGTFQPVKSETVGGHQMHAELIDVKIETIENILNSLTKTIIVVGTTSLRTVETLYWMGVKAKLNSVAIPDELEIKQWDVYQLSSDVAVADALQALVQWMKNKQLQRLVCKTQILIAPPYKLKVASALITNFHQPNSTLLLLVAAVAGNNWKTIYNYALENNFRFLSYGDSSLLYAG